ncbi:MAG: hypothetical protein CM15mV4_0440 [Caudoviricetes sp.]|nr:MAG: hypothetical protein CM15mV4_0440 [Caudoviricetes sp.]
MLTGYIKGQYVAIQENGLDDGLNGTFDVTAIDSNNRRKFTFELPGSVAGLGLQNNQTYTTANGLSTNAFVQAEVDSVSLRLLICLTCRFVRLGVFVVYMLMVARHLVSNQWFVPSILVFPTERR